MTLKELCVVKKTTFAKVSRKTGISQVYLSQLNTGFKTNPSMDILDKLSKVLKVKMEELQKVIKN